MPRRNRWVPILIVVCLLAVLGPGCGKQPVTPLPPGEKLAATQTLRYALCAQPEAVDSAQAISRAEHTVINALFEGLARLDSNHQPQPATASSWEASADSLRYTFHLRKDAKWSNGDRVTARDFAYAWLRVLNPATEASFADELYYIKGAQAYNEGRGKAEEVGIKALNDSTLEVTLEAPCPYFLSLTAFPTYFPVHRATVESGKDWAAEPAALVSNGPFGLAAWERGGAIKMAPNDKYWDRAAVRLKSLEFYVFEEQAAELHMFEAGSLEVADNPPAAELDRLRAAKTALVGPELATYYYIFNVDRAPFGDTRVRKAFTYAVDRKTLVAEVAGAGQTPAMAFVPYGIINPLTRQDFRREGGDCFRDSDVATARELLAEAGFPDGAGLPTVEVLYNDSSTHAAVAEAIQGMWKQALGLAGVTVTALPWEEYLEASGQGSFHLARAGWAADYPDPMSFLHVWVSSAQWANVGGWASDDYNALIGAARMGKDDRYQAMHRAEQLLMDEMPVLPVFFYTDPYLVQPYVRGALKHSFGPLVEFKNAYLVQH